MKGKSANARSEGTRARILAAAVEAFSKHGFDGASTRQIAALAGENQGLITYHFRNKDTLWKAAVDSLFGGLGEEIAVRAELLADADVRARMRLFIYYFVRYAARHPEQMRFMVHEGNADSSRMQWLVDRHLRRLYTFYSALVREAQQAGVLPDGPIAHLYYILIGATSLIFTASPECFRLTGLDPMGEDAIETHAETICGLVIR